MTRVQLTEQIALESVGDADFDHLAALRVRAMRPSLERIGRFDEQRAVARLREGFSAPHTRHILLAGEQVGFLTVKPTEHELRIDHLYVDPEHQGRGIGAVVLGQVIREAADRGVPLCVTALRESASNRFYLRHGFRVVREEPWDIGYVIDPGGAGSTPA